jgi:perosamine synthetase
MDRKELEKMIKLARPNISDAAIKDVVTVLRSGNLVQGRFVEKFERELEDYFSVNNAIIVSSGTAALHIALLALGLCPGDEVIVPAFTFPATANVVELVGATPVFVDISLDDYCIDTVKIEDAITNHTRAIIPVHEFGQSANMDSILQIAQQYNLKIIEDAACAMGTEFENKNVGTLGDIGCFSLHPRKALTTGEGGIAITNDEMLAEKLKALRNHGIQKVGQKFDFCYAGLNYRMTDFQAAIGFHQLSEFDLQINKRIEQADRYHEYLEKIDWMTAPALIQNRRHVYQTFHILIDSQYNRDAIIKYLYNQGVQSNYGAQALHQLNFYKNKYNFEDASFPNSALAYEQGLALPIGSHIGEKDIREIVQKLGMFS